MKKILFFLFFVSSFLKVIAQEDTTKHKFIFGKEKSGTVCVNGLEKLEFAYGSDRTFSEVLQLHFYGPFITSGRVWVSATQEQDSHNKNPVHFIDASVDLTLGEFPLHASYSFGLDQIGKKPNTSYVGPGIALYLSDIKKFHKFFHILRLSASYEKLTEHLQIQRNGIWEDSSAVIGSQWEKILFFQAQPFHITHNLTIFSEGLWRDRGGESFQELELGLRHRRVFEEMIGLGIRAEWENLKFHNVSLILRFNLSSPNPRHK